jgi:hypothetical protein
MTQALTSPPIQTRPSLLPSFVIGRQIMLALGAMSHSEILNRATVKKGRSDPALLSTDI